MPNIKPISDLRNYTEVLKQVDISNRVYLTRNGHGEYGILTMAEIDAIEKLHEIKQDISARYGPQKADAVSGRNGNGISYSTTV